MAHSRPWYKRNGGEFITGTLHMSLEQRGAYSVLIDYMNDREARIPDNPRYIAGILNCSTRKWGAIRDFLIADGKLMEVNGYLSNPRFERELAARRGEHEAAVEHGRAGGIKSAMIRQEAAQQSEMDFSDRFQARDKPEISPRYEKLDEIKKQKSQKSAVEIQPPPQPIRAREESRDIYTTQPDPSPPPSAGARDSEPDPPSQSQKPERLDDTDLHRMFEAVQDASGHRPIQPAQINRAFGFVERWRGLGISFDDVVIPTIQRELARSTDKITRTLGRFDPAILAEHAAQAAARKTGRDARPPPPPVFEIDGEDPAMVPIRREIAGRIGAIAYATAFNANTRLSTDRNGRDDPVLIISGKGARTADENLGAFRAIAKRHGLKDVWTR